MSKKETSKKADPKAKAEKIDRSKQLAAAKNKVRKPVVEAKEVPEKKETKTEEVATKATPPASAPSSDKPKRDRAVRGRKRGPRLVLAKAPGRMFVEAGHAMKPAAADYFVKGNKNRHPFSCYLYGNNFSEPGMPQLLKLAQRLKRPLELDEVQWLCGEDGDELKECALFEEDGKPKVFMPVASAALTDEYIDIIVNAGGILQVPEDVRRSYIIWGSFLSLVIAGADEPMRLALSGAPFLKSTETQEWQPSSIRISAVLLADNDYTDMLRNSAGDLFSYQIGNGNALDLWEEQVLAKGASRVSAAVKPKQGKDDGQQNVQTGRTKLRDLMKPAFEAQGIKYVEE